LNVMQKSKHPISNFLIRLGTKEVARKAMRRRCVMASSQSNNDVGNEKQIRKKHETFQKTPSPYVSDGAI